MLEAFNSQIDRLTPGRGDTFSLGVNTLSPGGKLQNAKIAFYPLLPINPPLSCPPQVLVYN